MEKLTRERNLGRMICYLFKIECVEEDWDKRRCYSSHFLYGGSSFYTDEFDFDEIDEDGSFMNIDHIQNKGYKVKITAVHYSSRERVVSGKDCPSLSFEEFEQLGRPRVLIAKKTLDYSLE